MIDKNVFFREVTIRLCSSLQIKTALNNAFEYLRLHMPIDTISLGIRDSDLAAIRIISQVATDKDELVDEIIPIPSDLWAMDKLWELRAPTIVYPDQDELVQALARFIKLKGNSVIHMPLWVANEQLGGVSLRAKGTGRYDPSHVELLATAAEPFAIALANALAHEKLLKYRDILIDDNRFLSKELFSDTNEEIIGENSGLRNVMEMARQVAPLDNSVLLLGETGTGKEVIANMIHFTSPRKDGPFIKVNCGAIPEGLIDSELFGHEKGAFTGAVTEKRGRFERADGGTIFLDEIGELPLHAQVRLLRVIQNREIERVGGNKMIPVNIRVIAATHRNLENMISNNLFREDLWYRLNAFPIVIPPLRHRKEDIPALTRHLVARKSKELKIIMPPAIAPGALQRLMDYAWPGNIRELENLVERELIRYRGGQLLFDSEILVNHNNAAHNIQEGSSQPALLKLNELMSLHISKALEMAKGKIYGPGGAAEMLGIEPNTLRARMDKLGIQYGRRSRSRYQSK
jgi:transcriptional regulator with GAF, ATPase, and Fis domain